MSYQVLSPKGKVIRTSNNFKIDDNNNLIQGLMICLDKLTKMKDFDEIEDYLLYGSNEADIKEEIARLLMIATTIPNSISPTMDISNKLIENHIIDVNSLFIKEFLELEARNKTNSFMKSDFYYQISKMVEEMEEKSLIEDNYYLNDSIILIKNIRNLYISSIDDNVERGFLDARFREPLIELFQHNLDNTQNKMKNGVLNNVQLQTRYQ